jgi:hypothetical protein
MRQGRPRMRSRRTPSSQQDDVQSSSCLHFRFTHCLRGAAEEGGIHPICHGSEPEVGKFVALPAGVEPEVCSFRVTSSAAELWKREKAREE